MLLPDLPDVEGAIDDNVFNARPAFNALLTRLQRRSKSRSAVANGGVYPGSIKGGTMYLLKEDAPTDVSFTGIAWAVNQLHMNFQKSQLTFGAKLTGPAITLNSTEIHNRRRPSQSQGGLSSLTLVGSSGTALFMGTASGQTYGGCDATVNDLTIDGFPVGIEFGANTYLNSFRNLKIRGATSKAIYAPNVANSGERQYFDAGCIAEGEMSLDLADPDADFYFKAFSFDYMQTTIGNVINTPAEFDACHLETNHMTNRWGTFSGVNCKGIFRGGRWLPVGTVPHALPDYLAVNNGAHVLLDGVYLYNTRNSAEKFSSSTGGGRIRVINTHAHNVDSFPFDVNDSWDNLLLYGSFEDATYPIPGGFSVATATSSAERLGNADATLTTSTTSPFTNADGVAYTKSMVFEKLTSNGSFKIGWPAQPGRGISFSMWLRTDTGTNGNIFLILRWVQRDRWGTIVRQQTVATLSAFAATTTWTRQGLRLLNDRFMPEWATEGEIACNAGGMSVGQKLFFAQVRVSGW